MTEGKRDVTVALNAKEEGEFVSGIVDQIIDRVAKKYPQQSNEEFLVMVLTYVEFVKKAWLEVMRVQGIEVTSSRVEMFDAQVSG